MNKILILKDLAYAAVSSGSAISTIADIDRLATGAIAVFDQDGDVVDYSSLSGTYTHLIFAVGLTTGTKVTTPVPVVVDKWNNIAYQAPVAPVVQIGDAVKTAQVDSVTLSGTSGTASVVCAGETDTATFDTDLATTAENFVTANAAAYLAAGVTLTFTSTGATNGVLVFTATVPGTAFTSPTITNATGDLAGTVVNTTANKEAGTTLQFTTTGDYNITLLDNTFTNKFGVRRNDASGYRQTFHTEEDVVDDVVAKLNANTDLLVTATKVGDATDGWGISVTPTEKDVVLGVSVGGMFEGTPVYSDGTKGSTEMVAGIGLASDILQMEKDYSVFEGNANSIEYHDEYFPQVTEVVSTSLYEVINILWRGYHTSPSHSKPVMNNRLVIAGVNGSTVLDNIQTILTGVLSTTGSKVVS